MIYWWVKQTKVGGRWGPKLESFSKKKNIWESFQVKIFSILRNSRNHVLKCFWVITAYGWLTPVCFIGVHVSYLAWLSQKIIIRIILDIVCSSWIKAFAFENYNSVSLLLMLFALSWPIWDAELIFCLYWISVTS